MTAGSRPHADDTIFRRATIRDILRRCSGGYRYTLPEAGMVEPLARGETLRVAMSGAGKHSARRQRGSAMLGAE